MPTRKKKCLIAAAAVALLVAAGCEDPYSQRRIQRRWDHFSDTAERIGRREQGGQRRVDEAMQTLRKWWESDSARFERRAPTVGDYVW